MVVFRQTFVSIFCIAKIPAKPSVDKLCTNLYFYKVDPRRTLFTSEFNLATLASVGLLETNKWLGCGFLFGINGES